MAEEESEKLESDQVDPDKPEGFPKADVVHRFIAKFIDSLIVAAFAQILSPVGAFAGMTYLLIADGLLDGRSLGKRLIGLQTLRSDNGFPVSYRESILRNIPFAAAFLLLYLPVIGWILAGAITAIEGLLVIGNAQGLRVGDEIARTKVVDGRPSVQNMKRELPINA